MRGVFGYDYFLRWLWSAECGHSGFNRYSQCAARIVAAEEAPLTHTHTGGLVRTRVPRTGLV